MKQPDIYNLMTLSSIAGGEILSDEQPVTDALTNSFAELFYSIQDALMQMQEMYEKNIFETPVEKLEFDTNTLNDRKKITMSDMMHLLEYLSKNSQLQNHHDKIKNLLRIFVQEIDADWQRNISHKLNAQDEAAIHQTFCGMLAVVILKTTIKQNDIAAIMEINKDYLAIIIQDQKKKFLLPSVKSFDNLLTFLISDDAPVILITNEEFRKAYKKLKIYHDTLKVIVETHSTIKIISPSNVKEPVKQTSFLKAFQLLKKKNRKLARKNLSPKTPFDRLNGIINGTVKPKNIKAGLVLEICSNLIEMSKQVNFDDTELQEFQGYLEEIRNYCPAAARKRRSMTVFGADATLSGQKKLKTNPNISKSINDHPPIAVEVEDNQKDFMSISSILN